MPELAEVEFYRRQWDPGLGQKILAVHLHGTKRVFRGTDPQAVTEALTGAKLLSSECHGKQILFRFTNKAWIGVHLGMSGKLRLEPSAYPASKHDHFVLRQAKQSLVFTDPRQFGRILFHHGSTEPDWWSHLPPRITSPAFTFERCQTFLLRHPKAPIKAVLLLQNGFPGIGNWMADEILWQSRIHPSTPAGRLDRLEMRKVFRKTVFVSEQALATIGRDFSDPPPSWLFRHRWKKRADCPRCGTVLNHSTIGGRTTCWCAQCQPQAV